MRVDRVLYQEILLRSGSPNIVQSLSVIINPPPPSPASRDYHRDDRGRPHRDGGRSWEPPSRNRRLHSGSDERGGGRHPRWEREREREHYHRDRERGDEYWSDYGHYERREYEEGRRPRPYHPERCSEL